VCDLETSRIGAPYIYDISSLRVKGSPDMYRAFVNLSMFICRSLVTVEILSSCFIFLFPFAQFYEHQRENLITAYL
jgi:hypothetical protein